MKKRVVCMIKKNTFDYVVVGLGNMGKNYEMTRHNIGFMVLDLVAKKYGFQFDKTKFNAFISETMIDDKRVLFVKPSTYMNNSGLSVSETINFYKLSMKNVIVIYDDISLDIGKIRIRRKGADGGHNGIKNIIYNTGTDVFPRIKIGISSNPHPDYNLADWVLSKFTIEEREILNFSLKKALNGLESIITDGLDIAMNLYN